MTLLISSLKKLLRNPYVYGTRQYRHVIGKMKNLSLDEAGGNVQKLYSSIGRLT